MTSSPKSPLQLEQLERRWDARLDPRPRLPYDEDRNCPVAQARKYNHFQREKAKYYDKLKEDERVKRDKELQKDVGYDRNIRVDATEMVSLHSATAVSFQQSQSPMELEIVQKILIRENFLAELKRLYKYQDRLAAVRTEVLELVKVIRGQTLDIVQQIQSWAESQEHPAPFTFKNSNYLRKIEKDFNMLGNDDEVTSWFGYSLFENPLAIPDSATNVTLLTVDGLNYMQLADAAKYIQEEKFRTYPAPTSQLPEQLDQPRTEETDMNGHGDETPLGGSTQMLQMLGSSSPAAPAQSVSPARVSTKSFRSSYKRSRRQGASSSASGLQSLLSASTSSESPLRKTESPRNWQVEMRRKRNRIAQLSEAVYREKQRISEQKEVVDELTKQVAAIDESRAKMELKRSQVPSNSTALFQQLTIKLHSISVQLEDATRALKQAQQILFNLRTECRRKQQLVVKLEGDIESIMVEREKQKIVRSLQRQQQHEQQRNAGMLNQRGEESDEELGENVEEAEGGMCKELSWSDHDGCHISPSEGTIHADETTSETQVSAEVQPEQPTEMPQLSYEELLELHFNSAVKSLTVASNEPAEQSPSSSPSPSPNDSNDAQESIDEGREQTTPTMEQSDDGGYKEKNQHGMTTILPAEEELNTQAQREDASAEMPK